MPTALIYDPYLDTLGGGERYTLTIAEILLDQGWQVDIAWRDQSTLRTAASRFNLQLRNLNLSPEYYQLFQTGLTNIYQKFKSLSDLDLVFVVSDGSVPILFGRQTMLHYQVPFTHINRTTLINNLKLKSVNNIIVNSRFTKKIIDKTLGDTRSQVLYPPIATGLYQPGRKTNLILSVGRFTSPSHSKRQDVLVRAFKTMVDSGLKNWTLALAGGQVGDDTILKDLKEEAKGYPIKFYVNASFNSLRALYSQASIYWHAAGFEVDQYLNPEATEHFGMTTVEAMSAGAVPVVLDAGGQPEIVTPETGFLYKSLDQLIDSTNSLIKDKKTLKSMSAAAQTRAQDFSKSKFTQKFLSLLHA